MKQTLIDKIHDQVEALQAGLQSSRPVWTRGADVVTLEHQLNKSIGKIIATELAQDPQLPPLYMLRPTEQRGIFQALRDYTKLLTAQVLQNIQSPSAPSQNTQANNNKENLNKKINTARKFVAAFLISLYELYDKRHLEKQHEKLAQLMAKANGKDSTETPKLYPQETPKEKPAPIPVLIPANMEDYELDDQLHALDLTVGATHEDIEEAYQNKKAEYASLNQPLPVAIMVAFNTLMATSTERLQALTVITPTEVQSLSIYLNLPAMLDPEQGISLKNIKTAFIEKRLQESDSNSNSPLSLSRSRKADFVMEKLEKRYGATPEKPILMGQELVGLSPPQWPSRLGQTPTLTMKG